VRADLISSISTSELTPLLDSTTPPFLLDVREPDEVSDWSIPGVHNIPLGALASRLNEVPRDSLVVVICALGSRAQLGAEILAKEDVASQVLDGGMAAWARTYDRVEAAFGDATVVQIRRRGKGCLSYVIGSGSTAIVIDPSTDLAQYEDVANKHGWHIEHILDTHLHADHVSGSRELRSRTGATLWLNPADGFRFDFRVLRDGVSIELVPGVQLDVASVSVPGHTEGSTMFQLDSRAIFTGDTLFLESVGRPDLADEAEVFARHLYKSLHERVLPLADDIMVFPAHYGASVDVHSGEFVAAPLGELRKKLAVLAVGEDEFVAWAVARVKDRPPNYREIVLINSGQHARSDAASELEIGPNRCAIAS
jgi:glyoxylase-like metal-dependent hydrolase (beta-lactamase superfamily II)